MVRWYCGEMVLWWGGTVMRWYFDFIQCFTTTFLRAHSWLNWVDEDDDEDEVNWLERKARRH